MHTEVLTWSPPLSFAVSSSLFSMRRDSATLNGAASATRLQDRNRDRGATSPGSMRRRCPISHAREDGEPARDSRKFRGKFTCLARPANIRPESTVWQASKRAARLAQVERRPFSRAHFPRKLNVRVVNARIATRLYSTSINAS